MSLELLMAITVRKALRISKKVIDIFVIDYIKKMELMVNALAEAIFPEIEDDTCKKKRKRIKNKWKKQNDK